nr:hypothetical protein [Tanacetum cinerariifolium]
QKAAKRRKLNEEVAELNKHLEIVPDEDDDVFTEATLLARKPQVPATTPTVVPVRVAAASTKRRKGVVIKDPEDESTAKTPADTKSKDKGKGIMVK